MSLAEMVNELPKLNHGERRELARRIFEVEDEEAVLLADCDHRADEKFSMLDEMEAQDGKANPR
jgi:hypothetical protein